MSQETLHTTGDTPTPPVQEIDPEVEAYLNSGYDKHIKQARNALFIIAGVQIIYGILLSVGIDSSRLTAIWVEVLLVAGIFTGLALWTKKKPYAALLTGLIFYIAYQSLLIALNPEAIFNGIILKVIIIVYLIKGMNDAKG